MANRSGLIALSDGVRRYFEDNRVEATVTPVGWRQRTAWNNQGPGGGSRVIFMPGLVDPGLDVRPVKGGTFKQPRHTHDGDGPRELVWWDKPATMSVWGCNPEALTDEEAQIAATEDLVELAVQGAYFAVDPETNVAVGLADLVWGDVTYAIPPVERAFGRELLVQFTHRGPLYDAPASRAFPAGSVSRNPST